MNIPSNAKVRKNAMAAYHSTVHELKKLEYLNRNHNELSLNGEIISAIELAVLTLVLKERKKILKEVLTSTNHKDMLDE